MFVGAKSILGINTVSFSPAPIKISAIIKFGLKSLTINRVPLQSPRLVLRFLNYIIKQPIFKGSLCNGIPEGACSFRNSTG